MPERVFTEEWIRNRFVDFVKAKRANKADLDPQVFELFYDITEASKEL